MYKQTLNGPDVNLKYILEFFPKSMVNAESCIYSLNVSGYNIELLDIDVFIVNRLSDGKYHTDLFGGTFQECVEYVQLELGTRYIQ